MYIDLQDQQIPNEFNTMVSLCFNANWQSDDEEWEKFKMLLNNVTQAVQDTGPDRFPVTQTNSGSQNAILTSTGNLQHTRGGLTGNRPLVGLQETNPPNYPRAISIVETDAGPHDTPETTDNLQPDNPNTTNRSNNGNPSNQQPGTSEGNNNSLGFSVTQSNEGSVIYQRTSTNRLNSNNSTSSSTTSSLQVENDLGTTQTSPGQTTSVATPPTTVMSTIGNNIEEQAAQAVSSASTAMQTFGTRAQAVASKSTTMQTAGTRAQTVASSSTIMHTPASREPPDGAATLTNSPPITMHNSSDTNLKNIVGRDNGNEDYLFSSLNRNDVELDNSGLSNSTNNQVSMYYSCSCFVKIIVYQPFSYENYICTNAGILYCSGVFLSGHLSLLMWAPGEGSNNNNHD
ncbi:Hypothetical predicted protein [Mytilus galloprovincialis]|uniref:Uncharacterized protein n=1 Tax=Mytilus galloprovincialis TaxID=29158 RepID=A0A8B6CM30_MYTGA|nr:Hypothetical predicted protein [Mytilus galloprovincialis]